MQIDCIAERVSCVMYPWDGEQAKGEEGNARKRVEEREADGGRLPLQCSDDVFERSI